MKRKVFFVFGALFATFLMFSTVTAVPCSNSNSVEESNIIDFVKEKINEENDDPKVQPTCGILWALICLWVWVNILGWTPPPWPPF